MILLKILLVLTFANFVALAKKRDEEEVALKLELQPERANLVSSLLKTSAERAAANAPIIINRDSDLFKQYEQQRLPRRAPNPEEGVIFREDLKRTTPKPHPLDGRVEYKPSTVAPSIETNEVESYLVESQDEPVESLEDQLVLSEAAHYEALRLPAPIDSDLHGMNHQLTYSLAGQFVRPNYKTTKQPQESDAKQVIAKPTLASTEPYLNYQVSQDEISSLDGATSQRPFEPIFNKAPPTAYPIVTYQDPPIIFRENTEHLRAIQLALYKAPEDQAVEESQPYKVIDEAQSEQQGKNQTFGSQSYKYEESQPYSPVESQPYKYSESQPNNPMESQPYNYEERQPYNPVESQLYKAVESQPYKTVESQPYKTVESQQYNILESQPYKVVGNHPHKAEESQPYEFKESQPYTILEQAKPFQAVESQPYKEVDSHQYKVINSQPYSHQHYVYQANDDIHEIDQYGSPVSQVETYYKGPEPTVVYKSQSHNNHVHHNNQHIGATTPHPLVFGFKPVASFVSSTLEGVFGAKKPSSEARPTYGPPPPPPNHQRQPKYFYRQTYQHSKPIRFPLGFFY